MADTRHFLGSIGARLALATVGVALGAIVLVAGLILWAATNDVSQLVRQQQQHLSDVTAQALTDAYRADGSWSTANLYAPVVLATDNHARLIVTDRTGAKVALPSTGTNNRAAPLGTLITKPLIVDGQRVGTALLQFSRSSTPAAATNLRNALMGTVAAAAAMAALLALGVAVVLSRRITRPIIGLTESVRSREAGDRSIRVDAALLDGTDEVAQLARAFDHMANTIEAEDSLRRAVTADVAHELRTPLAILQAGTESMADGVTAPTLDNLSSLHDEVLRLAQVVEDLDTLSSAEAAGLRLERVPVDVAAVVTSTLTLWRPAFKESGVELVADVADAPALVDPHRVGQIVTNLLSNSLKFTSRGDTVTLTVRRQGAKVSIEVADSGMGIPADELEHVYDRFWRGRQAGRLAGSGVGLAVVRALVEAHGGTVTVTSTPNEGSCFRVELPAEPTAL